MQLQQITTRSDAILAGYTRYYTGVACSKGHYSERYTSTSNCVACQKAFAAASRKNTKRGVIAKQRGHFSYPSHADDMAALLAYAQALDMARGLVPWTPPVGSEPQTMSRAEILDARVRIFGETANQFMTVEDPSALYDRLKP